MRHATMPATAGRGRTWRSEGEAVATRSLWITSFSNPIARPLLDPGAAAQRTARTSK
ncbi:MAG: hypothetical protein OET79_10755 [Nitrospirota bacterium]|nr:hypothetical protein [Nitrospirota bacterium]